MHSRLNNTSDNKLIQTIKSLQGQIDGLKQAQPTSGRSGILAYTVTSSSTWDASGSVSSGGNHLGTVTVTGDNSQSYPFVNLSVQIYINGTSSSNIIPAPNIVYTIGGATVELFAYGYIHSPNTVTWSYGIYCTSGTANWNLKATAYSSCKGTISAT